MTSTDNQPIKNIVIVGGGTIGWSCAVGLARGLQGQACNISVIDLPIKESPAISLTPHIFDFHKIFGIQEKSLLQSGQAKLTSSQAFCLSEEQQSSLFNGYDTRLPEFCSIEFHHLLNWLEISDYAPFSLPATASLQRRLALPTKDDSPIRSTFSCGLNINTNSYCQFMQGAARQLGVIKHQADIEQVSCNPLNGFIEQIVLTDGTQLKTELVIDNSGHDSLIINKQLGVPYLDSGLKNIFNRQLICHQQQNTKPLPYSSHQVTKSGWLESIQMHDSTTHIFSFHSDRLNDEQALTDLIALMGKPSGYQFTQLKPGRSQHFFYKNCVAVGFAAGYIGNPGLENLVLAQRAISKLLDLFPNVACLPHNQYEYNRKIAEDFGQAMDFQQLHLMWAKRSSEANFLHRLPEPSDQLAHRINLFKDTGRVSNELNPMISRQAWINLLQRCYYGEANFDPLLNALEKNKAEQFIERVASQVRNFSSAFIQFR